MQKEDIELYNTYNETKASIVERLIRTLKTKIWRYFTANKNIDILPDLVYSYNFSVHRSIKIKPADVTTKNETFWFCDRSHITPYPIGTRIRFIGADKKNGRP